MDWTEKRVFVTGAGGFIGSHLTESLVDHGADVRAFVRYNSRNDPGLLRLLPPERLDRVRILMGDLRDADAVRRAVRDVDVVFHLGSLIAIPYSYARPRETVETNVIGALNVLRRPGMPASRRSSTHRRARSTGPPATSPSTRTTRSRGNPPTRRARSGPTRSPRVSTGLLTSPSPRYGRSTPTARGSRRGR